MLTFRFSGADGHMVTAETLTSGMVGKEIKLEFTADWDGLTKTAVFTAGGVTRDVVGVSDSAVIPAEVLARPLQQLQVGIYGVSPDGRVTPTVRAEGPRILPGANPSGDAGTAPELPVWAQLQQRIKDLEEKLAEEGQSMGLNDARISALQGMFRACVFSGDQDVDSAVSAFETAFGLSEPGGDSGSGEDSGGPGGETAPVYTVTNNLTNVVNSNTATTVTGFYSAALSWESPNTLTTIIITMGGVDVTDQVYGDGAILITDVTGDLVITAEAGLPAPAYLLEDQTFDGSTGQTIDTGIALFDTDKDWTIFVSLQTDDVSTDSNRCVLYHNSTQSTYPIAISVTRGRWENSWRAAAVTNYVTISDDLTNAAFVVTHTKGVTKHVYYAVVGGELVSGNMATRGVGTDKTLKIGGQYDFEETAETNLFIGTVKRCEVHFRVLTEAEIKERLGVE